MQKHTILSKAIKLMAVGVITFSAMSPVLAVGATGGQGPTSAAGQQNRETICNATQTIIQSRLQIREMTMTQFTQRHENFNTKLNAIKNTMSENFPNIDLTNLNADIVRLQTMYNAAIQTSTEAYTAFGQMNFANCLSGSGEFRNQLQQARTMNKNAYDAHKAYWNFVKETVKPDLEAIRAQIQNTTVEE